MAVVEIAKIQVRRGQELVTGIPILDPGEFGWAQDTEHLYIGKRISEGAADDQNTRILTERDLDNIFVLIGGAYSTATLNTVYEYRQGILQYTTPSTLQTKLDSFNPSLTDFGVVASTGTYVQLDTVLQNAITDIFNNEVDPAARQDHKRVLEIPAGLFYLSNTVTLPPSTKLVGAGSGLTKIRYYNTANTMFKTVDLAGNTFEQGMTDLTTASCRDIVIEGMTLEFSGTMTTATTLLSLDNVENAIVRDCVFQTEFDSESTTTYGFVNHGIGIEIRGQGDNGTEKCRFVNIENCKFNGLLIGVQGTGTVVTPSIKNSQFSNLSQGIVFKSTDTLQGPVNGYIAYNRFQDILLEGIYVGANPNGKNSTHLSTQNYFARVGGLAANEFTTSSSVTSVISFFSAGNKSVDDYFARRAYVDALTNFTGFYYNPYVRGTVTIADSAVYSKNVAAANAPAQSSSTFITRIPLNGGNQKITMNYQLYSSNQSRSGTVSGTINSSGNITLTDNFDYVETLKEDTLFITANTGSGVNLLVLTTSTNTRFADVQNSIGNWYLTGSAYPDKVAYITDVVTSGTEYLVVTDSESPAIDFSAAGTWTLLTTYAVEVATYFDNSDVATKNFVSLIMVNPNTLTNFTLDYQIDIQT